jgi:pimeloyl-ACP methyl ester carboxylesterase
MFTMKTDKMDPSGIAYKLFVPLTAAGADLTGYNSVEAAADVEALRLALGVEQWNLLGGSYGTRWALTLEGDAPIPQTLADQWATATSAPSVDWWRTNEGRRVRCDWCEPYP